MSEFDILKNIKSPFYLKTNYKDSVRNFSIGEIDFKRDTELVLTNIDLKNNIIYFKISDKNNFDYIIEYLKNKPYYLSKFKNINKYEEDLKIVKSIINEWVKNKNNFLHYKHVYARDNIFSFLLNDNEYGIDYTNDVHGKNLFINESFVLNVRNNKKLFYFRDSVNNIFYYKPTYYKKTLTKIANNIKYLKKEIDNFFKDGMNKELKRHIISIKIDDIDKYITLYSRKDKLNNLLKM